MNFERHGFIVKSSNPPTIEVDQKAKAVYVRFTRAAVAKTVSQKAELSHIAIDLDSKGGVIGFEAVGISSFSLHALLKMASVKTPNMDFSRTKYAPTECVPA
jgi:uncharacterized protein YuzE